jgi:DNA-binding transcriptional MerR regulator
MSIVTDRTGLSSHVVRAWEKRYGAVVPERSEGNHRLYSEEDIERLRYLKSAVQKGHPIGTVARLPRDQLLSLLADDGGVKVPQVESTGVTDTAPDEELVGFHLNRCIEAVSRFDTRALERHFVECTIDLGVITAIERVVVPLLQRLGDSWQTGKSRIMHEHAVSAIVRTFLGNVLADNNPRDAEARAIVATPSRELHEFAALAAGIYAALAGWNVTYLGPNLPAIEIIQAARLLQVQVVLISMTQEDPGVASELARLVQYMPPDAALIAGGAGARAAMKVQAVEKEKTSGRIFVENLTSLKGRLDELRQRGTTPPD